MRLVIRVTVRIVKEGMPDIQYCNEFEQLEVLVGCDHDSDVVIPGCSVSKQHVKFIVRLDKSGEPKLYVVDQNSADGTFIGGKRLPPHVAVLVDADSELCISSYAVVASLQIDPEFESLFPVRSLEEEEEYQEHHRVRQEIHKEIVGRLDLSNRSMEYLADAELRNRAEGVVDVIVKDMPQQLPTSIDRSALVEEVLAEALGMGPIGKLLEDDDCSEILVNSYDRIFAEINGSMRYVEQSFSGEGALLLAIERLLASVGRQIDHEHPLIDVCLKDGSRVSSVIRPLATFGPCVTIRKPPKEPLVAEQLVDNNTLSSALSRFLKLAVENRLNILISGGTGSGKTTLLNVLANYVFNRQRVILVEEAAELRLTQDHLLALQTRPPYAEGDDEVGLSDLIQHALRMRPDRIIIGDCREEVVLDVLEVMNAGHDGSMTTGIANTPEDMIRRLETMTLASGIDMPIRAVREKIAGAFDLIVQLSRFSDGSRRVTTVSEVVGMDRENLDIELADVFKFRQDGFDGGGRLRGTHNATGYKPEFFRQLELAGHLVDSMLFDCDKPDEDGSQ